jgi:hypothetical protein
LHPRSFRNRGTNSARPYIQARLKNDHCRRTKGKARRIRRRVLMQLSWKKTHPIERGPEYQPCLLLQYFWSIPFFHLKKNFKPRKRRGLNYP